MKKLFGVIFIFLYIASSLAGEKYGLLIIAHGSPRAQWNKPVLQLEEEIKDIMPAGYFQAIRVALMEFNEPSINTVIKDFEALSINKVYAIPLLIAPSGHSFYDIPTILGF